MLFIAELAILGLFTVDIATHAIGFGMIFMKHMVPVLESLLIISNVAILLIMVQAD